METRVKYKKKNARRRKRHSDRIKYDVRIKIYFI